jgi:S-adenosyl methyltransferase
VPDFDTSVPHIARIYEYWLGGKDNFAADREAAERAMAATPTIVPGVRANRRFLGRAVRYMARRACGNSLTLAPASRWRTTPTRSRRQ